MRRIFVDVDTQNDFCSEDGSLSVPMDPMVLTRIKKLVGYAVEERTLIFGSVDTHTYDAWEFNTNTNKGPNGENPRFPPHCEKGTWGWLKIADTLPPKSVFVPNVEVKLNDYYRFDMQAVYFEKEVYSMFANPNAYGVLEMLVAAPYRFDTGRTEQIEFIVFGVATDYCVKACALELVDWCKSLVSSTACSGATVKVVSDAIAGVKKETTEQALQEMEVAGVKFIKASEFIGPDIKPRRKSSTLISL